MARLHFQVCSNGDAWTCTFNWLIGDKSTCPESRRQVTAAKHLWGLAKHNRQWIWLVFNEVPWGTLLKIFDRRTIQLSVGLGSWGKGPKLEKDKVYDVCERRTPAYRLLRIKPVVTVMCFTVALFLIFNAHRAIRDISDFPYLTVNSVDVKWKSHLF